MKKAEEILKDFKLKMGFRYLEGLEDLMGIIKYTQEETIKATVQACADNAELNSYEFVEDWMIEPFNMTQDDYGNIRAIDKSSILEVADKLIKELE